MMATSQSTEKQAEYHKRWYEKLTPDAKEALLKKNREYARTRRAHFTPERRESERIAGRRNALARLYGMTSQEYTERLAAQGGTCAIRGCEKTESWMGRQLNVDHCHATETNRGLLCSDHNTALGKVNDSIEELEALIDYLREYN